ncbi:MAG: dihydrofolate reductase family protein [Acidimicrobiia bacterium]
MAKLIFASNVSLDGWTEDEHGALDWAPPDVDVFASITEVMDAAGTYLYGRRMYETMALWETEPSLATQSDLTKHFAGVWQSADKIVYSTSLTAVSTRTTRLERHFDPDAVRTLKSTSRRDLLVGGPTLAGQAFRAGLIDECILYVWPVVLAGMKPALQSDARLDLDLVDEHRFDSGVVRLHYRVLS